MPLGGEGSDTPLVLNVAGRLLCILAQDVMRSEIISKCSSIIERARQWVIPISKQWYGRSRTATFGNEVRRALG